MEDSFWIAVSEKYTIYGHLGGFLSIIMALLRIYKQHLENKKIELENKRIELENAKK